MPDRPRRHPFWIWFVRWGIGAVLVLAGIVVLVAMPEFGVDGFGLAVGSGLSVIMINVLFRLGVDGDRERDREEAARRFLDEYGYWPDEAPPEVRAAVAERKAAPPGVPEQPHHPPAGDSRHAARGHRERTPRRRP